MNHKNPIKHQTKIFKLNFTEAIETHLPLRIEHFQQNGNIKNIAHIDSSNNDMTSNQELENKINDVEISTAALENNTPAVEEIEANKESHSLWRYPKEKTWFKQIMWIITWPIYLVFLFTIPDCEKPRFKKMFPLTFTMCIVWIGSLSYLVAWMITIVGDTLKIPDSVMGITFLAAGTSVPEAVSSVIVAKQGNPLNVKFVQ